MFIFSSFVDFVKVILGLIALIVVLAVGVFLYFEIANWLEPSKRTPDYVFDAASLTSQFIGQDKLHLKHQYEKDVLEVSGWVAEINGKYEVLIASGSKIGPQSAPYVYGKGIDKKDLAQFVEIGKKITIRGVWSHSEADGTTYLKKAIIVGSDN